LHKQLKREKIKDYTLDIDTTAILAEKKEAEMTYKGFKENLTSWPRFL